MRHISEATITKNKRNRNGNRIGAYAIQQYSGTTVVLEISLPAKLKHLHPSSYDSFCNVARGLLCKFASFSLIQPLSSRPAWPHEDCTTPRPCYTAPLLLRVPKLPSYGSARWRTNREYALRALFLVYRRRESAWSSSESKLNRESNMLQGLSFRAATTALVMSLLFSIPKHAPTTSIEAWVGSALPVVVVKRVR